MRRLHAVVWPLDFCHIAVNSHDTVMPMKIMDLALYTLIVMNFSYSGSAGRYVIPQSACMYTEFRLRNTHPAERLHAHDGIHSTSKKCRFIDFMYNPCQSCHIVIQRRKFSRSNEIHFVFVMYMHVGNNVTSRFIIIIIIVVYLQRNHPLDCLTLCVNWFGYMAWYGSMSANDE